MSNLRQYFEIQFGKMCDNKESIDEPADDQLIYYISENEINGLEVKQFNFSELPLIEQTYEFVNMMGKMPRLKLKETIMSELKQYFKVQIDATSLFSQEMYDKIMENRKEKGWTEEDLKSLAGVIKPKIDKARMLFYLAEMDIIDETSFKLDVQKFWDDEFNLLEQRFEFVEMSGNLPKLKQKPIYN